MPHTVQSVPITLTVDAPEGAKSYIARVTGRDPQYTFAREFVSRKHGGYATAMIDAPGLYELRAYDRKGRPTDRYVLYDGSRQADISQDQAMRIARTLEDTDWHRLVIEAQIAEHQDKIATSQQRDPAGLVVLKTGVGRLTGAVTRAALIAERERLIAELHAELAPPAEDRIARVRALMAELGVTIADLQEAR